MWAMWPAAWWETLSTTRQNLQWVYVQESLCLHVLEHTWVAEENENDQVCIVPVTEDDCKPWTINIYLKGVGSPIQDWYWGKCFKREQTAIWEAEISNLVFYAQSKQFSYNYILLTHIYNSPLQEKDWHQRASFVKRQSSKKNCSSFA